jgi:hypothetical protein
MIRLVAHVHKAPHTGHLGDVGTPYLDSNASWGRASGGGVTRGGDRPPRGRPHTALRPRRAGAGWACLCPPPTPTHALQGSGCSRGPSAGRRLGCELPPRDPPASPRARSLSARRSGAAPADALSLFTPPPRPARPHVAPQSHRLRHRRLRRARAAHPGCRRVAPLARVIDLFPLASPGPAAGSRRARPAPGRPRATPCATEVAVTGVAVPTRAAPSAGASRARRPDG